SSGGGHARPKVPVIAQRRANRALQGDRPRGLRRRRPPLAVDLHLVPYHGQPPRDAQEVHRSKAKDGASPSHAYATCYVIRQGLRFTVAVRAVSRGEPLRAVLQRLLAQAAKAGVRPRYRLLDRGSCRVAVLRALQNPSLARYRRKFTSSRERLRLTEPVQLTR